MAKIKSRNTALASHLAGSRGAGRHMSAECKYHKARNEYLDNHIPLPDELGDAIIAIVTERSSLGLGNSRLSDFLILGGSAEIRRKLCDLVACNKLVAFDILYCEPCGSTIEVAVASDEESCCKHNMLRKIGKSFSA
jgi:hypothetical protein